MDNATAKMQFVHLHIQKSIMARGLVVVVFAIVCVASVASSAQTAPDDMLCVNAPRGAVEPLPAEVAEWVTVLCTPRGMALAPAVKDKPVRWLTHPGRQLFLLHAVPDGATTPASLSKYDLRFVRYAATERTGAQLEQTLKMWDRAFDNAPRPRIDRVIQLDTQSVYRGTMMHLFLYVAEGQPQWIVACVAQCQLSVSLTVERP